MTDKDHLWLKLKIFLCFIRFNDKNLIFEILVPKYKYFLHFLCKKCDFWVRFWYIFRGFMGHWGDFFYISKKRLWYYKFKNILSFKSKIFKIWHIIGPLNLSKLHFFQNGRHGGHLGFAIAKKWTVFQPSTQVEFTSEGLN